MANYRIEFLDAENNPMAGCHFQIMHYSQVLYKGIADSQGRGIFHSDLIKNKKIWLRFWGKGQNQESAFVSQTFSWQDNVITQPIQAPTVYEVELRETENKNNEPEEYRQAFYEVQEGDTWESIAQKCETEAVLIRLVNNLPDDSPLEIGDALLLPRGAKRPPKQPSEKEVLESIKEDDLHKVMIEKEEKENNTDTKASEPIQPSIQDNPQPVPEAKKEPAPQLPKQQDPPKKPKLDKMRSAENGKPETKVKKDCSEHCKVEVIVFPTSKGSYAISKQLWDFILSKEAFVAKPYVPAKGQDGKSGVTLGYGYDLGQQKKHIMYKELANFYTPQQLKRLEIALGVKGINAQALIPSLQDITISKENAKKLAVIAKQRYAEDTVRIYPQILQYHPHCQGALLSLIYNRGAGLKGERRKEMREIQQALAENRGYDIPNFLIKMKRLWVSHSDRGVAIRREEEANLFKKGLDCDCF
ncbi:Phage-related lysozyme (muraminidase) [Neisseria zoodegmatis]|uniref:Phage-related lysozyme (Muraminidase) n=1 Tax=Neisseria zoodegmatis TaxID=326523 RepID=A0A378WGL1_9NEIS|nr:LysM peptidoglycan-binding domain-containing protein [Neisseria zoodegmatis]SUA35721.1 Phage-related lysozyme (muraminidase) [Neisseria zoodegmatis]